MNTSKLNKTRKIRSSKELQSRARELRQVMTPAEHLLWDRLRDRRLSGIKFRRQHPLGAYIVDFYCPAHRLVVEIDGGIHQHQLEDDLERTRSLESQGYRVIRFRNFQVEQTLETVLASILRACLHPSPACGRAGDEGEKE